MAIEFDSANHEEILRQGSAIWNQWRDDNPDIRPELEHVDLREKVLRGFNFTRCNFKFAKFSNATLVEVQFDDSNLSLSNFRNAEILETNFISANLRDAEFFETKLIMTDFHRASNHTDKTFYRCATYQALGDPQLENELRKTGIPMNEEKMKVAREEIERKKESFPPVNIENSGDVPIGERGPMSEWETLENPDGGHLDILKRGADFWNDWYAAHPNEQPSFQRLVLSEIDLRGVNLKNADFTEATLYDVDFREADFQGATFDRARIIMCDFSLATGFENVTFEGSRFHDNSGDRVFDKFVDDQDSEMTFEEADAIVREYLGEPAVQNIHGGDFFGGDFLGGGILGRKVNIKVRRRRPQGTVRASSFGDDAKIEENQLPSLGSITTARKEANEHELGLRNEEYAQVLATYFRSADDGEFCFALFGPWGRGKTTLVREFAKFLTGDISIPSARSSEKPKNYEIVEFSAWKYRTTPEVWVHLYESFRKKCLDSGFLSAFPRVVRTGIAKHGLWPIAISIFTISIPLVPMGDLVRAIVGVVGAGTLLTITRMYYVGRKSMKSITKSYGAPADHREKLGLQAAVGDDLKALLQGWIPEKFPLNWGERWKWGCERLAKGTVLLVSVVTFWLLLFFQGNELFSANARLGILWIWPLFWSMSLIWVIAFGRKTDRVLFTVDDLDRCEPSQMLEIIESLKLLLEDNAIQNRVQIVMMIEENALRKAILDKFESLIEWRSEEPESDYVGEKKDLPKFTRKKYIQEHIEKLFISHIRLGRLSQDDINEVARNYVGIVSRYTEPAIAKSDTITGESTITKDRDQPRVVENETDLRKDVDKKQIAKPKREHQNVPSPSTELSDVEKRLLVETLETVHKSKRPDLATPRAIRSFILKYKLCRLIYQVVHGEDPVPKNLVDALFSGTDSLGNKLLGDEDVSKIVRMVN